MSTGIAAAELKPAIQLTTQVKGVDSDNKKYPWTNLHRLTAGDGRLTLYTNDGQVWLTWNFRLVELTSDSFDVIFQSEKFNEAILRSSDGTDYEISDLSGLLQLKQGPRDLKIPQEAPKTYPEPRRSEAFAHYEPKTWTVSAVLLARGLRFILPFLDTKEGSTSASVVTWGEDGRLVGGTVRVVGCVLGLPAPASPLSFRPRQSKAITSFLESLSGEVIITDDGNLCHFDDPVTGNRLTVSSDLARSNMPKDRAGKEDEIIKIDGTRFLESVVIMGRYLPLDMNQIQLSIEGNSDYAIMKISNNLGEKERSKDEVPIMRDLTTAPGDSAHFSVNSRVLEAALKQMKGSILTGKYYKTGHLHIEDEKKTPDDITRVAMLIVSNESIPAVLRESKSADAVPVGT